MSTIEQAERLRATIAAALGDLVDTVTLDGSGVKQQTRAAVVIFAPKLSYPTYGERDVTFKIAAVAGPPARPLEAWRRLDAILTRLEDEQFNLATADPASFDLAGAGYLPAYEITLNPL